MKWWVMGLVLFALDSTAQELKIGFGTHKPPYLFENQDKGLEYDIIVAAARAAGLRISASYAPRERLHRALNRGELDGIATTNSRGGITRFYSQPYIVYDNVAVALTSRGYQIESIADLAPYSISAFQRARFQLGEDFQRIAEASPRYREEAQQIAQNRLLFSGRIDVVVGDSRVLRYFNREVYSQVDVSQPVTEYRIFPPTHYQLGLQDKALRNRFDQGLAAIRASGEYQRIEQRYALY
ncbi:transporter substrate-binding domain-containing protein [Pseudomonas seleniipraecipitans]|uniref:Transporter substrate-binding domain-containing protein n=1 Tax=Phytopseudomonas seleniipraecipitans TaxID=640205 RepID=A0ABY5JA21_9GAMM|nr:transporter substrate-binding domain-containing protein [Pseudomonas seleniipraecipitans]UUD64875.1 transporter substrate-binding domain-containing protein [Pseudomonas seleniipraecipitans]